MIQRKDIIERKFNRSWRGYDPVEVTYFLEMLADEFEKMEKRLSELEPIENQLEQMKVTSPENIIKTAEEQAKKIIADAEKLATDVLDTAKQKKETENEEIIKLEHHKNELIQLLNKAIRKQTELLNFLSSFKSSEEDGTSPGFLDAPIEDS
jgi:DivIVA domain-containing protein